MNYKIAIYIRSELFVSFWYRYFYAAFSEINFCKCSHFLFRSPSLTLCPFCNALSAFLYLQLHLQRFLQIFLQIPLFFLPIHTSYLTGKLLHRFDTKLCHLDLLPLVSANYFCNGLCKCFCIGAISANVSATVPKSVVLPGYARILRAVHTTIAPFAEPDALACQARHAGSVRTQVRFLQIVSANYFCNPLRFSFCTLN